MVDQNSCDEEQKLHVEHIHEEQVLHEAHIRAEEALHCEDVQVEEEIHAEHVREEEALRPAHEGLVEITVDDRLVKIKPGQETVVAIKNAGSVSLAYDLVEEKQGRLEPLPDDGSVNIKGCEVFHSHVKTGGSS